LRFSRVVESRFMESGSTLVRRALVATIVLISLACPVLEAFDSWDHTIQTGQDTEAAVVVLALCVGVGFVLTPLIGRLFQALRTTTFRISSLTETAPLLAVPCSASKEGPNTITTREVWTISDDGKMLTKTRHTSGPRGERDQKYAYDRQ